MKWLLVFLLSALGAARGLAQTPAPGAGQNQGPQPLWRCELPGGTYEVAVRAILSVSSHEYVVDGAARVTEVNVDTAGSMAVRFYYIEPLTPTAPLAIGQSALEKVAELTKEAAGRVDQDALWQKVVKSYPLTTHARTIEYRLESKTQLESLFKSAEAAFRQGRNTTFKP